MNERANEWMFWLDENMLADDVDLRRPGTDDPGPDLVWLDEDEYP